MKVIQFTHVDWSHFNGTLSQKKKVSERQPDSKGSLQRENAGSKTDEREMQVRKGAEVCLKNPHRMGIWQMMEGQF